MDILDFFKAEIDTISETDVRNGYYMMDLLGDDYYGITVFPQITLKEVLLKSVDSFKLYKSNSLIEKMDKEKRNISYITQGRAPFGFGIQMILGKDNNILPTIICPRNVDCTSYAFFGHEFHHALKDVTIRERKIRDRVAEVIPMFYEMLCVENENDEKVSKEILRRRVFLLQADKENETDDTTRQLQYFNSYYYALALYNKYKKKENKILILRLISRVLCGEINTLDLLNMLNIYDSDSDYIVSRELESIKQYIHL